MQRALSKPTADDLWLLRGELLEAGIPRESEVWGVLGKFEDFLDHLATSTSSRGYSELASRLDIGAVGGIALEHVLEPGNAEEVALRLFSGLVSEGLMVLATRQHVRAWAGELAAIHRGAARYLYEELWRWAERRKPDLSAAERRRLLEQLLGPIRDPETDEDSKLILIGRLFQILLASHLSDEIGKIQG